ncbi:MAG: hypothetical protein NTV05_01630 [Acidobacteria bacterium]|nr:hypothetical protein [Acidobacteriota bacterium]
MTLDEQLTDIIAAARRQIMARVDERIKNFAGEVDQAAASDWEAAIREVRLAADGEIVERSQAAIAAARTEADRRAQETVAASRTEADRRTQEAVAAAQAEATERLADAAAAAQADLEQRVEQAASAARAAATLMARAEAERRIAAAVADARRETDETARQTASQALVETHAAARQSELAQIDRLVDAVRRLDGARSLTDVLNALGEVTSREAPRVALFLVRGSRLAGWRATGFGAAADPHPIDVASDQTSLLWRAIATGQPLGTAGAASGDGLKPPFGELGPDAAGLAVPVLVGGEAVAVIYADDAAEGPRTVPSAWPEVIEVLARHAARCLEVLTVSRGVSPAATAQPLPGGPRVAPADRSVPAPRAEDDESAHRYARLLVSEIKLYHEAAVTEGRQGHNLAERLRTEIDRARTLYEARVPIEIRTRTDHFGQELVRTLADGDPSLLGASWR